MKHPDCDCMFCKGFAWFTIYDWENHTRRNPNEEETIKFWEQHDRQKVEKDVSLGLVENPS